MMELKLVAKVEKGLSREDRLRLIQTLNALPTAQFDEIVFALAPPQGNIPRDCASQSQRSQALLGPKIAKLGFGAI